MPPFATAEDDYQPSGFRTVTDAVVVDAEVGVPARLESGGSGLLTVGECADRPEALRVKGDLIRILGVVEVDEDQSLNYPASDQLRIHPPEKVVLLSGPTHTELIEILDVIYKAWPDLPDNAVAHVFADQGGSTRDLMVGKYTVPHVEPHRVQELTHIRVLLAKMAITTGWDCPRAEVFISLRGAENHTYITQLLGRMVRSPLAERIDRDPRLNAVSCFLPRFNEDVARQIARELTGRELGDDSDSDRSRVLTSPVELVRNPAVPAEAFDLLAALPSEAPPLPLKSPIRRLFELTALTARDALVKDLNQQALAHMVEKVDGLFGTHQKAVAEKVKALHEAEMRRITASVGSQDQEDEKRTHQADELTIREAFRQASRALTPILADHYLGVALAADPQADGLDIQAQLAVLPEMDGVVEDLEEAATSFANARLSQLEEKIATIGDEAKRRQYAEIRSQATTPQRVAITVPEGRREPSKDADGKLLDVRPRHLLADTEGNYPVSFTSDWEWKVVDTELGREDTVAWYRNPSRSREHAVIVPYEADGEWKPMYPDFIFFTKSTDGVQASIVDPHGHHFEESVPKLRGLALFAEKYGEMFHRIESVAKNSKGEYRRLDLKDQTVRDAVSSATSAGPLYDDSKVSSKYE